MMVVAWSVSGSLALPSSTQGDRVKCLSEKFSGSRVRPSLERFEEANPVTAMIRGDTTSERHTIDPSLTVNSRSGWGWSCLHIHFLAGFAGAG